MIQILSFMLSALWKIFLITMLIFIIYLTVVGILEDVNGRIEKIKYKHNEKILIEQLKKKK